MLSGSSGNRRIHHGEPRAARSRHARRRAKPGFPCWCMPSYLDPSKQPPRGSSCGCDWERYSTYLASRPDAAEVEAIRLMIELSRKYRCRVHIVHLSSVEALAGSAGCARGRPADHRGNLPALSALCRRRHCRWSDAVQMRAAHPVARESRTAMAGARRGRYRFDRDRSFALPA